jgi:HD-like signal output (HDOD) protein
VLTVCPSWSPTNHVVSLLATPLSVETKDSIETSFHSADLFSMVHNASCTEQRDAPATSALPSPDSNLETDTVVIPVKLCNLPPLNAIANQVLALSADPDVDLKQLSAVIECDPAFAAAVLFLANSSLFGFPSRMRVLRHAIAVLGLDCIKALAVTVAMRGFLGKGGPLGRQCWRHSAACALIAEQLSPIFDITGGTAYSVGILHDIGRLGLLKSYTAEYSPVLAASFKTVEQVLRAERAVLHVDHGLAGAWLVKTWALPQPFIEICEHHHEPVGPEDPELLRVVKTACRVADALGFAAVEYSNSLSYDDFISSLPPHIHRDVFPSGTELRDIVEARLRSFE